METHSKKALTPGQTLDARHDGLNPVSRPSERTPKSIKTDLKPFRLGDWLVLPHVNRISGPSGQINIGARTMMVLACLARSQGRVITKEELMKEVWDDVIVTEDSLIKSISVLRQTFQHNGTDNPQIDTVRAIGYMLITPVEYVDGDLATAGFKSRRSKMLTYATIGVACLCTVLGVMFTSSFMEKPKPGQMIKVTDDWGQERVPRFSPDGSKVLFAGATEGWNNMDIYIKDLNKNKSTVVVDGEFLETDPIWSPDGNSIAFFRNEGKKISIYTKNLTTQEEKKITGVKAIINLSAMVWSADGEWIIYADYPWNDWKSSLYKVNLRSGIKIRLTHPEGRIVGDLSPRLSPDGRRMAFIRAQEPSMMHYHLIPGRGKLCLREEVSSRIEDIIELDSDVSGVAWIDKDHLAYATIHNNYSFRIYQLNIHTLEKEMILQTEEIIRNLDFHVPTNRLVFETWNEHYSIWNYTAADKEPNFSGRFVKNSRSNWQPKFNKEANSIAYISMQSGTSELWLKRNDTGEKVQLTNFGGPVIRNASWSPDGKKLAFEVNDNHQDDIYTIDIESLEVLPLLTSSYEEKYPQWSEDGQHVYFSSDESGRFNIWKKEYGTSAAGVQITDNGGYRGVEYAGDLYFIKPNDRGIWKYKDQKEEQFIAEFSPGDAANWDIMEDQLYYIRRGRFWRPEMYRYDFATNEHEHYQSFTMPVSRSFSGLTFDSTSGAVLITHNDRTRSDLKMIVHDKPSFMHHQISFVSGL